MVRVLVTTNHRGLAESSVQRRLYSKQLWTLVSVQTQGPPLLGTSWLRTHDKGRATNLLPCNNLLWGKSFKGTAAGQKKPLHLDWQWGKLPFVHQETEFLVAMERTRAASVYLGKQTFPLHPDLRTSLHGSRQHQRAYICMAGHGGRSTKPPRKSQLTCWQTASPG